MTIFLRSLQFCMNTITSMHWTCTESILRNRKPPVLNFHPGVSKSSGSDELLKPSVLNILIIILYLSCIYILICIQIFSKLWFFCEKYRINCCTELLVCDLRKNALLASFVIVLLISCCNFSLKWLLLLLTITNYKGQALVKYLATNVRVHRTVHKSTKATAYPRNTGNPPFHDVRVPAGSSVVPSPADSLAVKSEILCHPQNGIWQSLVLGRTKLLAHLSRWNVTAIANGMLQCIFISYKGAYNQKTHMTLLKKKTIDAYWDDLLHTQTTMISVKRLVSTSTHPKLESAQYT